MNPKSKIPNIEKNYNDSTRKPLTLGFSRISFEGCYVIDETIAYKKIDSTFLKD